MRAEEPELLYGISTDLSKNTITIGVISTGCTHKGSFRLVAPEGVSAINPTFDITPNKYIAGIITEVGVLEKPFNKSIKQAMEG